MKILLNYLLIFCFLTLVGCGNKLQETNTALRTQIIEVHDEVMPKMGELMSLEKKALAQADSLSQQDSTASAKIQELTQLAGQLKAANEGMFVWMRQYSLKKEGKSPEELKSYLDSQLVLAKKVRKDIQDALAQAALLKD
jgi:hypothetical protein